MNFGKNARSSVLWEFQKLAAARHVNWWFTDKHVHVDAKVLKLAGVRLTSGIKETVDGTLPASASASPETEAVRDWLRDGFGRGALPPWSKRASHDSGGASPPVGPRADCPARDLKRLGGR